MSYFVLLIFEKSSKIKDIAVDNPVDTVNKGQNI